MRQESHLNALVQGGWIPKKGRNEPGLSKPPFFSCNLLNQQRNQGTFRVTDSVGWEVAVEGGKNTVLACSCSEVAVQDAQGAAAKSRRQESSITAQVERCPGFFSSNPRFETEI